ncbi:hypothetical protein [Streptomyces sp. NBC_01238]|uniref:hypothetical protein n=1 Tax=Streptomyces sp. NBC_01238 TaxID=2903791 RepID=UPI00386C0C0A
MGEQGTAQQALPAVDQFEAGWRDDEGEHRRPLADVVSVEFEAGLPVRGFPSYRGQRHFPGLYWSATTGGHVGFESWLERDHAMLLDFTPEVTGLLFAAAVAVLERRAGQAGGWWWTADR